MAISNNNTFFGGHPVSVYQSFHNTIFKAVGVSLVLLVVDGKVIGHGFGIAGALVDNNDLVLGEPVDGSHPHNIHPGCFGPWFSSPGLQGRYFGNKLSFNFSPIFLSLTKIGLAPLFLAPTGAQAMLMSVCP